MGTGQLLVFLSSSLCSSTIDLSLLTFLWFSGRLKIESISTKNIGTF